MIVKQTVLSNSCNKALLQLKNLNVQSVVLAMLCHILEGITSILHKLVTGMFCNNNNNIESLHDNNTRWNNHSDIAAYLYQTQLKADYECPCYKVLLHERNNYCLQDLGKENENRLSPLWHQLILGNNRGNLAMLPSLNKSQRVQLCNANLAMEWTIAGLYICRYMHRRVSNMSSFSSNNLISRWKVNLCVCV